ncbi:MAG TPA: metallophosphoesterase [Bryobacteraceae bacterium]
MGIENAFLRALPSTLFIALGIASQIYLVRRFRISQALNAILFLCEACLFLISQESLFPYVRRLFPSDYTLVIASGTLILWCWLLTGVAIVLWLKDRVFQPRFRPERRAWLTASAAAVCAAPAAVLCTGILTRKNFDIREVDLKFKSLPTDLRGLRLVQISDIHMGDFFSAHDLERAVAAANELRPDLAFVTGDLITTKWDPLDACLRELGKLHAFSGVWGCLGNHEMRARVENYTTTKALEFDVRFLRRQAASLIFGESRLNLVGVDHQRHVRPYLEHVEDLVAPGAFNLLLSHNPDVFPVAARKGFDLTLAGHTHGGQINLAIAGANLNIADLATPYTKGFYELPGSSLYVNSGLGTIGVPVRLGAPPEITLIRLCDTSS